MLATLNSGPSNADAKRILLNSRLADWRRQRGRPCITWLSTVQQDLETTPSYAPQSSRFGSEPPSVEDDVNVWRYAIVSCMPETTNDGICLSVCDCLCVCVCYVTLSVNLPTGQTPQQIFTVNSLKDADLCKDVPFGILMMNNHI